MPEAESDRSGIFYAVAAYGMWGFAPIYFKELSNIVAVEILMHRVIWSFFLVLALTLLLKRWPFVQRLLRQPRYLLLLGVTSLLIAANWLIFIWSVSEERMLEASLGYYINPLINVVLGMLFLGERLRNLQWTAVGLALCGVLIPVMQLGQPPWIALALAFSFGSYGLLRKRLPVDALTGLLMETALLLPLALVYWNMFLNSKTASLIENAPGQNLLLISAGVITTLPLLCFAAAAKRMPLSNLGFFQYIAPSLMFLLAVGVYGEPLETSKVITFAFIWSALVLFTTDAARQHRRRRSTLNAN